MDSLRCGIERSLLVVSSVVFVTTASCAHAESAEAQKLTEMEETIARVQTDRDREDARLGIFGVRTNEATTKTVVSATPRAPGLSPRVVSLGQSDAPLESDDPNDPTPRPEIRIVGPKGTKEIR